MAARGTTVLIPCEMEAFWSLSGHREVKPLWLIVSIQYWHSQGAANPRLPSSPPSLHKSEAVIIHNWTLQFTHRHHFHRSTCAVLPVMIHAVLPTAAAAAPAADVLVTHGYCSAVIVNLNKMHAPSVACSFQMCPHSDKQSTLPLYTRLGSNHGSHWLLCRICSDPALYNAHFEDITAAVSRSMTSFSLLQAWSTIEDVQHKAHFNVCHPLVLA
jgi:hypothetical protein